MPSNTGVLWTYIYDKQVPFTMKFGGSYKEITLRRCLSLFLPSFLFPLSFFFFPLVAFFKLWKRNFKIGKSKSAKTCCGLNVNSSPTGWVLIRKIVVGPRWKKWLTEGWDLRFYSPALLPASSLLPEYRCNVTNKLPVPSVMPSPFQWTVFL